MKKQSKNQLLNSSKSTSNNNNPDLDNELFEAMQGWVSDEQNSNHGGGLGFVQNYEEEYECVLEGGDTPDYNNNQQPPVLNPDQMMMSLYKSSGNK